MSTYIFPGQGSQTQEMGADLWGPLVIPLKVSGDFIPCHAEVGPGTVLTGI